MLFKKLLTLTLAICLVFTLAVSANSATYSLTQTVGSESATISVVVPEEAGIGLTFQMDIYLEGKHDGFELFISEYTGVTVSSVLTTATCQATLTDYGWIVGTPENFVRQSEAKTLMASIIFKVAEDAPLGDIYLDLDYITQGTTETNSNAEIAKITIADKLSEYDMDQNGSFTYADVSKIYSFFRETSTPPAGLNTDINDDGKFSYLDVSRLYNIFRTM